MRTQEERNIDDQIFRYIKNNLNIEVKNEYDNDNRLDINLFIYDSEGVRHEVSSTYVLLNNYK